MVGFVVQRGDRWCGFMKSVPKLISPPFSMLSGLLIPFLPLPSLFASLFWVCSLRCDATRLFYSGTQ